MNAVGVIGGEGRADVGERSREGEDTTGREAVRRLKFWNDSGDDVRLMSLKVGDRGLVPLNDDFGDLGGVKGDHFPSKPHDETRILTLCAFS